MSFVQVLVYARMVQTTVNPVNGEVGEKEEEWELKPIVPRSRTVSRSVVHFAIATNFGQEKGNGVDSHDRYGFESLLDFESDLVFEVFGMFEGFSVEDKVVRESGEGEVEEETE